VDYTWRNLQNTYIYQLLVYSALCVQTFAHTHTWEKKKIQILLISEGRCAHINIPCTKQSCSAQEVQQSNIT